jgi:hypothetical protein
MSEPMKNTFDILLLIARPAAGKSETIHYLKQTPLAERIRRFHIGEFEEIDDFPMLWAWFEEDDLLDRMGYPRVHNDAEGYFLYPYLWDVLIERICLEYTKKLRDDPAYHRKFTILIEFSRGTQHGGYASAFQHLSRDVVQKMAILYIDVPWEESLRKNRRRFNPNKPDSILEHALPDEKLERLYKDTDWEQVRARNPETLVIQGVNVPYVVFSNADDVTTAAGEKLGSRLEECLGRLWEICRHRLGRSE